MDKPLQINDDIKSIVDNVCLIVGADDEIKPFAEKILNQALYEYTKPPPIALEYLLIHALHCLDKKLNNNRTFVSTFSSTKGFDKNI